MCKLAWLLTALCLAAPVWAKDTPLTVATAHASANDAVETLVQLNEQVADKYFDSGEWVKSVAALDCVIALRPQGIDAYANAAWLLWSSGKDDAAMEYYHHMIAANPTNAEGYFIVGDMLFSRRKYAEALPWLQHANTLGLTPPYCHLLGHTLEMLGRTDEAIAFWQQLLKQDPKDTVASHQLDELRKKSPH